MDPKMVRSSFAGFSLDLMLAFQGFVTWMEAGTIGSGTLGQAGAKPFVGMTGTAVFAIILCFKKPLAFEGSLGLDCWTTGHDGVQWYHDMSRLHGHLLTPVLVAI